MAESPVLAKASAVSEPDIEGWNTVALLESWLEDEGEDVEAARQTLLELTRIIDDNRLANQWRVGRRKRNPDDSENLGKNRGRSGDHDRKPRGSRNTHSGRDCPTAFGEYA